MTFNECKNQLEKLFGAFSRELKPQTINAWFEDLQGHQEHDLAEAIRMLKFNEKLPNLGETMRQVLASVKRAQARIDAQDGYQFDSEGRIDTKYGKLSRLLLIRIFAKKVTPSEARACQRRLMKRYKVNSNLTMPEDSETSREQLKLWQDYRWREDLSNLSGLRKVTDRKFEAVR